MPPRPHRKDGNAGNSANILDGSVQVRVRPNQGVERREKGADLSAKGQVRDTEVGHGGDAGLGGDDGDLGHVEMGPDLVRPLEHFGEREVPDRLALASDTVDVVLQAEAFLFGEFADPFSNELSELFSEWG
jgi:hypothetical protein